MELPWLVIKRRAHLKLNDRGVRTTYHERSILSRHLDWRAARRHCRDLRKKGVDCLLVQNPKAAEIRNPWAQRRHIMVGTRQGVILYAYRLGHGRWAILTAGPALRKFGGGETPCENYHTVNDALRSLARKFGGILWMTDGVRQE